MKTLNNNGKKTPQINLGPPKKEKKKDKSKVDSGANSKEFPGSKIDKNRKEIFGVSRIQDTLKRINEENVNKAKERKAQANKKFLKKGGSTKSKKEPRKEMNIEGEMELDEKSVNSQNSFLSKKRTTTREDFEEDEITEAKLADKDLKVLEDKLDLLKYTGDNDKDWMTLIKEAEEKYYNLELKRVQEIDAKSQLDYTKESISTQVIISAMKAGKIQSDDPERRFKWVIDDLNYFVNSKNEDDKKYKDEKVQIRCLLNGMVVVMQDLLLQINTLKQINIKHLIALKKLGEENIKLKVATDDRILQLEKPVTKWVKEENNEISPEEKRKREERRKIKEAEKSERIRKYKENKTWIEEEAWRKMSAGSKALHRFVFSDVHQNLTHEQWNTITREQKNMFINAKNDYREKRMREIEELGKKEKEKAEKAKRQFNFFQFRVIDKGIVCDLQGNPFRNSRYQKRY